MKMYILEWRDLAENLKNVRVDGGRLYGWEIKMKEVISEDSPTYDHSCPRFCIKLMFSS